MSRVQELEEQMIEIKVGVASRKDDYEDEVDESENEQGNFTRSQARDKAMGII